MDMKNKNDRNTIRHARRIDSIRKIETVTPFGVTVINAVVGTILITGVTLMVLALIWKFY